MPVKNEDWILETTLKAHSLWADHIIVADEGSTDKTPEICKKFSKVVYIQNKSKDFNEQYRRQLLLDSARNFEGNNLIFALDADELLNYDGLSQIDELAMLLQPGASACLEWVELWGDQLHYNKYFAPNLSWKHFVYLDDRATDFQNRGMIHLTRVPEKYVANSIVYKEIKVVHFAAVDLQRPIAKNRYYRIIEVNNSRHPLLTNKIYYSHFNDLKLGIEKSTESKLVETDEQWLGGYNAIGIDFNSLSHPLDYYWYDGEVLKYFCSRGLDRYKWLDIWDVDWNEKLKLFKKNNPEQDFLDKVDDPRSPFIKFYHRHQDFLEHWAISLPFGVLRILIAKLKKSPSLSERGPEAIGGKKPFSGLRNKFINKIWWRLRIFFNANFYQGGLYSIIFLIPLSIRKKYPQVLSLSGFLSRRVKAVSIKHKGNGYIIKSPKFVFEVPFVSDDFFDIFYPFLDIHNSRLEKILNNPFYVEGRYLTKNCCLRPGDRVIDAGANVGFFSILASKLVGDSGQVYSFEPVSEANMILKNNIEINDSNNIEVVEKALGDKAGEVEFYIDGEGLFEGSSVVIKPQKEVSRRKIIQTTIDEFVLSQNLDRIDFIKVDIEGAERCLLAGAEKTIKKYRPKIAIRTYHLPDDPEVIEGILKSYVPEYKIEKFYNKTIYAYL